MPKTKPYNNITPLKDALASWPACNEFLRTATELEAANMLKMEKAGKKRVQYMMRIFSRFNSERANRERREMFGAK